jgi:hypothetical protein
LFKFSCVSLNKTTAKVGFLWASDSLPPFLLELGQKNWSSYWLQIVFSTSVPYGQTGMLPLILVGAEKGEHQL